MRGWVGISNAIPDAEIQMCAVAGQGLPAGLAGPLGDVFLRGRVDPGAKAARAQWISRKRGILTSLRSEPDGSQRSPTELDGAVMGQMADYTLSDLACLLCLGTALTASEP